MAYGDSLPCPHNDDGGGTLVSNSYMMKMRLDIKEAAGKVEELATMLHQWGYGFERLLQQRRGAVNIPTSDARLHRRRVRAQVPQAGRLPVPEGHRQGALAKVCAAHLARDD